MTTKKTVKESPSQGAKRVTKETIDKLSLFAMQQLTINQRFSAVIEKQKTIIDILVSKLVEGELDEFNLTKDELAELESKYLIENGVFGPYAIEIDTCKILKYKSCLEGWKIEDAKEVETPEGEPKQLNFTFKKQDGLEVTREIVAANQPEAFFKLRNEILGL